MPDLRVAFWNVNNLLEPGPGTRRPRGEDELDARLDSLAGVLDGLFEGAGPDLLGLAEIQTEAILERLEQRLRSRYLRLFEPSPSRDWTGLSVLARTDRFASIARVDAYRPWAMSMPRYLIARCELHEGGEPILFVVNHWASRLGGQNAARERGDTGQELGNWLSTGDRCVIVIGDFNAEPFEEPFGERGLRCVRNFSLDLWRRPAPACLYNTAWRFLSEPDLWEVVEASGAAYVAPRPITTWSRGRTRVDQARSPFNDTPPVLLDQLLVSGRALQGGPITLREASIAYPCADDIAATEDGHRRPVPWTYEAGRGSGASDHFPLVATFCMNEGGTHG